MSALHDLFADKYGNSMVVEVGAEENSIINGNNKFTVMTNFTNKETIGKNYREVYGVASDKYIAAYENIEKNFNTFNIDSAFDTLDKASKTYTLSSLIFDPAKTEVYIALKRQFSKIWKVSLKEGTIETYKGFNKYIKVHLGAEGVLATNILSENIPNIEEINTRNINNLINIQEEIKRDIDHLNYLETENASYIRTGFTVLYIALAFIIVLIIILLRRLKKHTETEVDNQPERFVQ